MIYSMEVPFEPHLHGMQWPYTVVLKYTIVKENQHPFYILNNGLRNFCAMDFRATTLAPYSYSE